jgi:hypothetical protein
LLALVRILGDLNSLGFVSQLFAECIGVHSASGALDTLACGLSVPQGPDVPLHLLGFAEDVRLGGNTSRLPQTELVGGIGGGTADR